VLWKRTLVPIIILLAFVAIFALLMGAHGTGFKDKTLWDWLNLLIVPAFLGAAALWFNRQEKRRTTEVVQNRTHIEQEIAKDRQLEEAMQNYLDKLANLLQLENLLERNEYEYDPVVNVARVRTVTALRTLDRNRRNIVLQFLRDAKLAEFILSNAPLSNIDLSGNIVWTDNLSGANLRNANLNGANLIGTYLHKADLTEADLRNANLCEAFLIGTNLGGANLEGANLRGADLSGANLRKANLSDTNLSNANLCGADLSGANLSKAFLVGAELVEANLSNANLRGAYLWASKLNEATLDGAILTNARGWTGEQIAKAKPVRKAILLEGTKK